jgi:hypothetical protein
MKEASDIAGVGTPGGSASDNQGEGVYFAYSASLRIFGSILNLDEITERLGVTPRETHRRGDRGWGPNLPLYDHDMWSYKAPVNKGESLHAHIDVLWKIFREPTTYLLHLKQNLTVDVFGGIPVIATMLEL